MASPVSLVSQLASALWALKTMYDQHKDNKQEIKELEEFFDQYGKEVPGLQETLKTCKGTDVAATVLNQVETDIAEALKKLNDWCTETKFFRVFTSSQRMEELRKLHRNVMASVQNNLQKATLSILVLNLRENQAQGSSSNVKLLNSTAEVKSVLTTQIGSMDYNVAVEVRDVALKASHASYADEKFWADVIAAIDNRDLYISKHQSLMDPILLTLMIDPVVTSNGITYCRWTIIDNNMKDNPHNPREDLVILADNASLRSELFEAFPEQMNKFRQRRSDYRSKALLLVEEGQVADAAVHLQHVLEWDKKDEECVCALAKVSAMLESFGASSLQASPSDAHEVAGSSSDNMIEAKTLEIPSIVPETISLFSLGLRLGSDDELRDSAYCNVGLKLHLKKRWFRGHSKEINHVQWSPNGKEIATASKDRTVVVWDTKQRPWQEKPPKGFLNFSWQIATSQQSSDKAYNQTWWGRVKLTLKGHSGSINCVAYNVDGRQIATASSDNTVRIWNAQTGKTIHTLESHSDYVTCVAWSTLGLLASTSADESTKVWNGRAGKELFTLKGHLGEVTCAAWSPSGDRLATTSADYSTIVWLIEGQKKLLTLNGHKAKVTSVAWNCDGKFLVTASFDKSIVVWDSKSGCGMRYEGFHSDWINSVAWCPITNLIATASEDSTARVVDTTLETCIEGTQLGHSQQVRCVSWCPKGNYFVTASYDKSIKIHYAGISSDFGYTQPRVCDDPFELFFGSREPSNGPTVFVPTQSSDGAERHVGRHAGKARLVSN